MSDRPKVLMIVTQDSKAAEARFVRECLEDCGVEVYHLDPSVRSLEESSAEITPDQIAIRLPSSAEIRLREGAGLKEVAALAQAEAEKSLIKRVLTQTNGNKKKSAEILKIDYTTLFEKLKKYGLQTRKELTEEISTPF